MLLIVFALRVTALPATSMSPAAAASTARKAPDDAAATPAALKAPEDPAAAAMNDLAAWPGVTRR